MRNPSRRRAALLSSLLGVVVLVGCASAPVQEMSNARQAIRAAQDAGAAAKAPSQLAEAQGALNRAESLLNRHFYRSARRSAEEAHVKALAALEQARGTLPQSK